MTIEELRAKINENDQCLMERSPLRALLDVAEAAERLLGNLVTKGHYVAPADADALRDAITRLAEVK